MDISEGNLACKLDNLARIAEAERMDVCVLQECPGSDLAALEGAIGALLSQRERDPEFYLAGGFKCLILVFQPLTHAAPGRLDIPLYPDREGIRIVPLQPC